LYSGKPKDPLRGYLITRKFYNKSYNQPYEALSYVWGDSERRKSMILNNQHFAITPNLYTALQHIRSETSNRFLWIDAICINQADKSERNYQLSIMGDIYKCAQQVVNWLGPATPNTALGMEVLAFLFGDEDITSGPPWENHKASLLRAGLDDILKRDYFQRI
jgi:Heterokaryon incompatibility protein (HET)